MLSVSAWVDISALSPNCGMLSQSPLSLDGSAFKDRIISDAQTYSPSASNKLLQTAYEGYNSCPQIEEYLLLSAAKQTLSSFGHFVRMS